MNDNGPLKSNVDSDKPPKKVNIGTCLKVYVNEDIGFPVKNNFNVNYFVYTDMFKDSIFIKNKKKK